MNRLPLLSCFMACSMSVMAACDVIDDPGFQLWCGEELCAWVLEEGEIRKVSTWHEHDYGVELVGAPVLLSQGARESASCARIEVTSQIEPGVMVSVEVDAEGDGDIDWVFPVEPSDEFVREVREVPLEVSLGGVFYIRKTGQGQAVVGRLRVAEELGCLE